jgi:hypothetical protein
MKKIIFIIGCMSCTSWLFAQEPADALRYSWITSNGSARQQAVGGAMVSLGGDISSGLVNPAGLGFYKTSEIVLTPGINFSNNKATYFGHMESMKKNGFGLGASGIVWGEGYNRKYSKVRGTAWSIVVNQTANFRSNLLYRGVNTQSSYSQKFLEEIANNNDKDANSVASAYPFGTSLAFNTYWIDTIAGGTAGNFQFQSRAPVATGLIQENHVQTWGGITELSFAGAVNLKDKLMLGATFGIPFLHYRKESTFKEADATVNPDNKFDIASITENLVTEGVGLNIKLGLIYKPVEYVRLGFAVHSPTYYSLSDKYNASVTTNTENYKQILTQSSGLFTNGEDAEFKYTLLTPLRIMGSISYVLREIEDVRKQRGFLTADIEYVNYRASSFKTDPEGDRSDATKDYLRSLNRAIDAAYKSAFNFKAGGELKFTVIMARLGFAYYGNPYKNINGEKGHRIHLSGGLGYRNKGMFIDLAYVHMMGKDVHAPYRLDAGTHPRAFIKSTGANALLTIGFKI